MARPPLPEVSQPASLGPAPESENQRTSSPAIIETLPQPAATAAEVQPAIPAPPARPATPRPKRAAPTVRTGSPATASPEATPVVPQIKLVPQISEEQKNQLIVERAQHIKLALDRMRTVRSSDLEARQQANVAAVQEFIDRSNQAIKRREYHQALVLAQKASTLADNLSSRP